MPCGSKPAVESLRREMGVDVLITGHTHKLDIWQGRDRALFVNPGSVRFFLSLFVIIEVSTITAEELSNTHFPLLLPILNSIGNWSVYND